MKIVISGSRGLLGRTLGELFRTNSDLSVVALAKSDLDITNRSSLVGCFEKYKPDWFINCSAFTNVDLAELDATTAFNVNAYAMKDIARSARELDVRVMHFSTDYVFDGLSLSPYRETDEANPINKYGLSKLKGEQILLDEMPQNAVILRTAWLYGAAKSGFLSHVISQVKNGQEVIKVVCDVVGQLTLASDVAITSMEVLMEPHPFESQLYHVTNQGFASWLEIGEFVNHSLGGHSQIMGIHSEELKRPASRPAFSALDSGKFSLRYSPMRHWTTALDEFLNDYHKEGS